MNQPLQSIASKQKMLKNTPKCNYFCKKSIFSQNSIFCIQWCFWALKAHQKLFRIHFLSSKHVISSFLGRKCQNHIFHGNPFLTSNLLTFSKGLWAISSRRSNCDESTTLGTSPINAGLWILNHHIVYLLQEFFCGLELPQFFFTRLGVTPTWTSLCNPLIPS